MAGGAVEDDRLHRAACVSRKPPNWSSMCEAPSDRVSLLSRPRRNAPCSVSSTFVPPATKDSTVISETEIRRSLMSTS